jgi:hypothetical protein
MRTKLFGSFVRRAFVLVATICLVGVSVQAYAVGNSSGQIGEILVLGSLDGAPGNEDFRVYLAGDPVICNGNTWAYVNISDANYQAIVANILTARTAGVTVTMYWIQQTNGFCEIEYMYW